MLSYFKCSSLPQCYAVLLCRIPCLSRHVSAQAALLSAYAALGERTGGRRLAALAARAQAMLPRFSGHDLAGMARALIAANAHVPVSLCQGQGFKV